MFMQKNSGLTMYIYIFCILTWKCQCERGYRKKGQHVKKENCGHEYRFIFFFFMYVLFFCPFSSFHFHSFPMVYLPHPFSSFLSNVFSSTCYTPSFSSSASCLVENEKFYISCVQVQDCVFLMALQITLFGQLGEQEKDLKKHALTHSFSNTHTHTRVQITTTFSYLKS